MSKVLITGSAEGLGREAAKQLARGGHEVVLHARDDARAQQVLAGVPGRPTPEGVHRDGVDFALVMLVRPRRCPRQA